MEIQIRFRPAEDFWPGEVVSASWAPVVTQSNREPFLKAMFDSPARSEERCPAG
jgi:hypothetical protein